MGLASWVVEYNDGGHLSQYDGDREVPYRAIDWPRVSRLILESQLLKQTFDINPSPDIRLSLRSRHFMRPDGTEAMCFILIGSQPGSEVAGSTQFALYWFPDGTLHECRQFDCSEVRRYAGGLIHGEARGLMPRHDELAVRIDADLSPPTTKGGQSPQGAAHAYDVVSR